MILGCYAFSPLAEKSPVEDEFKVLTEDSRSLYKNGARDKALIIASQLDKYIEMIAAGHQEEFSKKVTIHICDTPECFQKCTGNHALIAAAVSDNGLFLSPRAFINDQLYFFLAHELSHLHLFQQIILIRTLYIPQWFHDGVATYFSNGGGAQYVNPDEAKKFILSGNHIVPIDSAGILGTGGMLGDRWPITYEPSPDHKFQQNMNYQQSAMFCEYLAREGKVVSLLRLIENGSAFKDAFLRTYDGSPAMLRSEFVDEVRSS